MKQLFSILGLGLLLITVSGCEDYLGDKTDLDFIDVPPDNVVRDIAYVPILPILSDFVRPVDITVGFDQLIYVVDAGTEEVVAMDEAGNILARKRIPGAKAVVQDRKFDLLVIGTHDTLYSTSNQDTTLLSLSAIYRLRMTQGAGGYDLARAQIVNKIVHPFYYSSSNPIDRTADRVAFERIDIIGNNRDPNLNNQFYVTRSGEGSSGPLGPNDAILYFNNQDEFISPISVQTSTGFFNDYFEEPHGITTLTKPPQLEARGSRDFLFTSLDPTATLNVQYIEFNEGEFGAEYRPRILAASDTSQADGFINEADKFRQPMDVTLAGDGSQFIFVVDGRSDSLYQFSFSGFEGVLPPAASGENRYQKASFGGTGNQATQFNQPSGVAYWNDIVYVADAGNGRVLRFKLTLDFR